MPVDEKTKSWLDDFLKEEPTEDAAPELDAIPPVVSVQNLDGSSSSERTISVEAAELNDGKPTLIPTLVNGKQLSDDEAIRSAIQSRLQYPSFKTIEEAGAFAATRSQAGGAGKQGRLLVVEEGMKYEGMAIDPNDAQYLETRVFQIRDIARIFRLPPHKLGDLADATFSNVEEQNREYVDDCLAPWLVQWEQEIASKLLMPSEAEAYYPRFFVDALLRGNATTRAAFYSTMYHIGGMTINEVRDKEDLDTIGKDGDAHMVPVNLQPADKAANPPPPAPPPAIVPAAPTDPPAPPTNGPTRSVDAAHRALLRDTCARICRERTRGKGRFPIERGITLLLAPVTCAAAAAGATECDPAAICARMLEGHTEEEMLNAALLAIEEEPNV